MATAKPTIAVFRDLQHELAANFKVYEFACQCGQAGCGILHIDLRVPALLQKARDLSGRRFYINKRGNSRGYRCPLHPDTIATPTSRHAISDAVDVNVEGLDMHETYELLKGVGFTGLGIYPDARTPFVHADLGRKRTWARVRGEYVSLEAGWKCWRGKRG
jgi:hypothetical protein